MAIMRNQLMGGYYNKYWNWTLIIFNTFVQNKVFNNEAYFDKYNQNYFNKTKTYQLIIFIINHYIDY